MKACVLAFVEPFLILHGGSLVAEGLPIHCFIAGAHSTSTSFGDNHCLTLMQLSVKHIVRNTTHLKHLAEQLGNLNRSRADQARTADYTHGIYLIDDGAIFLAGCLIDSVIHIDTLHGAVGRYFDHIQFVDIPELTSFSRCRTRHTGKLVIHAEIVLQRDGSESLRGSFYLHMFLGLNGLVKSIAPTTAFHDTASLLINDLDLTIHNDIFVVLIKHCIGLEQLLQSVNTIALNAILIEQLIFLVEAFLIGQVLLVLEVRKLRRYIGQHKQIRIIRLFGQPCSTLIRKICRIELFVHHKIQWLYSLWHLSIVIGHIKLFRFQHTRFYAVFRQEFNQRLVLGQCFVRAIKRQKTFLLQSLCFFLVGLILCC